MTKLSSVDVLGAGPGGLYTAILLKRAMPDLPVRVIEQNPADATFGFGVVFSDRALDFLKADDAETHDLITPHMERWQNMTLVHRGEVVTLDGVGFAAVGRLDLLKILQQVARDVGVDMRFDTRVQSLDELEGDLVVGADGLNSLVRTTDPDAFETTIDHFGNHFAWFGTSRTFETLTQTFIETPNGPMNAHHYRYAPDMSTFIVECDEPGFKAFGFGEMDEAESARACEAIFAETLQGAPLVTNRSMWRQFPRLWCGKWYSGNRVLLGDAVHTAHFSIGSGTRLAMEDAIALVRALREHGDIEDALPAYDAARRPVAAKIVQAANTSASWYDAFREKMVLPPLDFAYDYLMRSGRIDQDRLRTLAPAFAAQYEAAHAARVS
jgi:2-polyprenyl-6-methoxyphenol hydroxylase-like FAD-dependent oxidoreductase